MGLGFCRLARAWLMMARAMCAQRDWGEAREACRGAIHAAELSRHPLGDKFNEEASRLLEKIREQIRAHNDAKRRVHRVYTYVESQQMGPSVHAEDSKSLGFRTGSWGARIRNAVLLHH